MYLLPVLTIFWNYIIQTGLSCLRVHNIGTKYYKNHFEYVLNISRGYGYSTIHGILRIHFYLLLN